MGGTVYAVAGGKGGVGKTTVTANVAVALRGLEYDVAVVDADIELADVGALLGVEPERSVHEALAGGAVDELGVKGPAGITVVPGERRVEALADADPANLREVIEPLADSHDIVLVDTGAGIGHPQLVAYGLADAAVLVATETDAGLAGLERSGEMVEHVDGTVLGAVVTRVSAESEAEALVRGRGFDLLAAVPEYEEGDQEPRVLEAADSPAAAEYERLANALSVFHQLGDVSATTRQLRDAEQDDQPQNQQEDERADDESAEPGLLGRLASRVSPR